MHPVLPSGTFDRSSCRIACRPSSGLCQGHVRSRQRCCRRGERGALLPVRLAAHGERRPPCTRRLQPASGRRCGPIRLRLQRNAGDAGPGGRLPHGVDRRDAQPSRRDGHGRAAPRVRVADSPRAVLAVLPVGAFLLLQHRGRPRRLLRDVALLSPGLLGAAVLLAIYNRTRFGSPVEFGYAPEFSLAGFWVSPSHRVAHSCCMRRSSWSPWRGSG